MGAGDGLGNAQNGAGTDAPQRSGQRGGRGGRGGGVSGGG